MVRHTKEHLRIDPHEGIIQESQVRDAETIHPL